MLSKSSRIGFGIGKSVFQSNRKDFFIGMQQFKCGRGQFSFFAILPDAVLTILWFLVYSETNG